MGEEEEGIVWGMRMEERLGMVANVRNQEEGLDSGVVRCYCFPGTPAAV